MKTFEAQLASINDVKQFVTLACQMPFDIDIISGRYVIDAKSIMGIFSVDLSKPFRIEVHGTDEDVRLFKESIQEYVVG